VLTITSAPNAMLDRDRTASRGASFEFCLSGSLFDRNHIFSRAGGAGSARCLRACLNAIIPLVGYGVRGTCSSFASRAWFVHIDLRAAYMWIDPRIDFDGAGGLMPPVIARRQSTTRSHADRRTDQPRDPLAPRLLCRSPLQTRRRWAELQVTPGVL